MKVLVTGANGQLGRALQECTPAGVTAIALRRDELDITDAMIVSSILERDAVDTVINAAAYTDVAGAERDASKAFLVNETGAGILAASCADRGIRMVHVSTDFVFDGDQRKPYSTSDEPHPLNAYGASKLAGERRVLGTLGQHACVVRTSWLHSPFGGNFVTRILAAMTRQQTISVVENETGTPTAADSLALALWKCATDSITGVQHWCDAGAATRIEYAELIAKHAVEYGLIASRPRIVPSDASGTGVRRPAYSVLDTLRTQEALDMHAQPWSDGVRRTILQLSRNAGVTAA